MFTIEQIKTAHARVKSGADFPAYIREMKQLGVNSYEHKISNGRTSYYGKNGFTLAGDAKWPEKVIAETADQETLIRDLKIHQNGGTDYLTFCDQAANAGIDKWVVDTIAMTCVYYDKKGQAVLEEKIPG